jgi:hypothetical protein
MTIFVFYYSTKVFTIHVLDVRPDTNTGILYGGLDFWNNTTPDSSRVGEYSSLVFADEAVRIINQKVNLAIKPALLVYFHPSLFFTSFHQLCEEWQIWYNISFPW